VKVRFLGTGTSHGVPMIGCRCQVCRSPDPRDARLRPSIVAQLAEGCHVLVDTSTDLRQQALRYGVERVDAILFTHSHADHILGLDETRRYNVLMGGALPIYGDRRTIDDLRRSFSYVFEAPDEIGGGVPRLVPFVVAGPFCLGPAEVVPVPIRHGPRTILGYRVGGFAYLTDCNGIPDTSWALLEDLDTVVIGALRHRPHPTHFTVAEAVEAAGRIGARRTLLTHICHDLGHVATSEALPRGVELAYDGLEVEV